MTSEKKFGVGRTGRRAGVLLVLLGIVAVSVAGCGGG
jgi:hypothetical protein